VAAGNPCRIIRHLPWCGTIDTIVRSALRSLTQKF
jgi:hypothetical protein